MPNISMPMETAEVRQGLYWTKTLSTAEYTITPYFIELDEADIADQAIRAYINKIPTSFSLQKEQVDILIDTVKKGVATGCGISELVA